MMDLDLAEIQGLTMDEIAGVITEEERAYLHEAIANNREAYAIWHELHQSIGPQQLQEAKESMRAEEPREIVRTSRKRQLRTVALQVGLVTIIVLFAGIELWYYLSTSSPQQQAPVTFVPKINAAGNNKPIRLQLENGKQYDLSDAGTIQAGVMTFTSIGDTLRYTASGKAGGWARVTVPAGKEYHIVLPDGSIIQLNSSTQLTFPLQFEDNRREVTADGEAYFIVAASPSRPFVVNLPHNNVVRALGTEFNVNSYDSGKVRVALIKGAVKLEAADDSMLLKPGFEITSASEHPLRGNRFDPDTLLSWRTGTYIFGRPTKLREMSRILPRIYGVAVKMDNNTVAEKVFTGSLNRNQPIGEFVDNIRIADSDIYTYYDADSTLHFR
jgi:ferric-dicitrate binding protein FerR (iron transport regulator)